MRAAIYARYSPDLQSVASIEDQVRECRERAERDGWTVVEVYSNYAISGGHINSRPGMLSLLEAASAGAFEVVLAEALDRICRDQEYIAGIYKRLTYASVKMITLSEGEVNELHIGLKGTMNALFLKDLAEKIKRGQRGRVEAGKVPAGNCYGYRVVKLLKDDGTVTKGERAIEPDQATIIRRIFAEFIAGLVLDKSPHASMPMGSQARRVDIGMHRASMGAANGETVSLTTKCISAVSCTIVNTV
jgi:site-specific DNA recombinase